MHPNVKKLMLLGGSSVLTPDRLPGLAAWYSADYGVLTSVGPDVAATDGQTVRRWLDRSGNGRHLDQATLLNQPTFTNTATGLTFNGASSRMTGGDILDVGTGDFFAVAVCSIATNNSTVFAKYPTTATNGRYALLYESAPMGGIGLTFQNGADVNVAGVAPYSSATAILTCVVSRGERTSSIYRGASLVNTSPQYTSASADANNAATFGIGALLPDGASLYWLNGTIKELVFCNADNRNKIAALVRGLSRKWGVAL